MSIASVIARNGGIVRRADHPEWTNARLRAEGIGRIGAGWLAVPDARPELVRAAELRARLACVSAAGLRGFALLAEPARLHVAVPRNSTLGARPELRIHRSAPILPVGAGVLVESVPDLLAHVARCLPRREALVVWESALHEGAVSAAGLRRMAWHGPVERALAAAASPRSESILETLMLHGLREAGLEPVQQARLLGHRVDFLLGGRLVVQVDGFAHHRGGQREEDLRHDARLMVEGFVVLRFGYRQVVEEWARTLAVILGMLAQARAPLRMD